MDLPLYLQQLDVEYTLRVNIEIQWGTSASSYFSIMSSNSVKLFWIPLDLANLAQGSFKLLGLSTRSSYHLITKPANHRKFTWFAQVFCKSASNTFNSHNPNSPWTWCSCDLQYDISLFFQCKKGYLFCSNTISGNNVSDVWCTKYMFRINYWHYLFHQLSLECILYYW